MVNVINKNTKSLSIFTDILFFILIKAVILRNVNKVLKKKKKKNIVFIIRKRCKFVSKKKQISY